MYFVIKSSDFFSFSVDYKIFTLRLEAFAVYKPRSGSRPLSALQLPSAPAAAWSPGPLPLSGDYKEQISEQISAVVANSAPLMSLVQGSSSCR